MFEGVPNLVSTFGYTNASWTLKADLIAGYACRLLNFLHRRGFVAATPPEAPGETARPFMDLTSGYVQRAVDRLPKQGATAPWLVEPELREGHRAAAVRPDRRRRAANSPAPLAAPARLAAAE